MTEDNYKTELNQAEQAYYEGFLEQAKTMFPNGEVPAEANAKAVMLARRQARAESLLKLPVVFNDLSLEDQMYFVYSAREVVRDKHALLIDNIMNTEAAIDIRAVADIHSYYSAQQANNKRMLGTLDAVKTLLVLRRVLGEQD